MLKVNVGLSRKLSRDYNSTGFSLNLEGEICVGMDDPEAMIEKVKELYDLAEEALNQQIERYEGESAIAGRDQQGQSDSNAHSTRTKPTEREGSTVPSSAPSQAPRSSNGDGPDAATNKQVQYLLNLGKRQGLTSLQLEGRIATFLGRKVGVYDLSKREAGEIIDSLSQSGPPATNGNGRSRTSR